jgi:hypothetical protein
VASYLPKDYDPAFVERVERAHAPDLIGYATGFSSHAIEAMTPDEFGFVLHHAATIQRGHPENMMHEVQRTAGGGIYSYLAEHVGDLTHRINEMGGKLGTEFVTPKVRVALRTLEHPYGVEREHKEQMASNRTDMDALAEVGARYAQAHRLVPTYNRPSSSANYAAMDLGKMNFTGATMWLNSLRRSVEDPDKYKHEISQEGSVEYLRRYEHN